MSRKTARGIAHDARRAPGRLHGLERGGARSAGKRVKLTMFMGNSGLAQPTGVDPSNNWAINVIEDYANVDLELEIPAYNDFPTKLNLLLASGNLPDIVHGWQLRRT